jgi:hypothetical protein
MVEALVPGSERLSRTDVGVIAWRRFAGAHARRPKATMAEMPEAVEEVT